MLGPEGVARALVGRMSQRMPAKLAELRTRLGVDAYELPDLDAVYPTEINVLAVGRFPCIAVVEFDTSGRVGNQQTDMGSGFEEYLYRYRMRVFVWGMADGHVETDLLRKRLALSVREVLLQDKVIHNDEAGGQYAEIDPKTLRESFSDIGAVDEQQVLGGAYIEVEVVTQEQLAWLGHQTFDAPDGVNPGGLFDSPAVINLTVANDMPFPDGDTDPVPHEAD